MQEIYFFIKALHIFCGAVALVFGLLAILYRGKTAVHKKVGRVYFWSMGLIFVTALYMASVKFNLFLLGIAFFSYYSCLTAFRALRLKKLHQGQKPATIDWVIESCFGLAHLAFVGFAIYQLASSRVALGTVSLVFGLLGLNGNRSTYNRLTRKPVYRNYWLLGHLGGMLGSYIATITAFVVNNEDWFSVPPMVLWLAPTVLIVPFIVVEVRKQQKRGGRFDGLIV